MRHTSNIDKVEQLGRAYDEKVLKWRAEQEWHQKFQTTLETISECIEECEAPLGDDHLSRRLKIAYTHFNETVKNDLSKQLANITTVDSTKLGEVRVLQEEINSNRPSGYQIIGDNRDLLIKVRHQASAKPNKGRHPLLPPKCSEDQVNASGYSDDGPFSKVQEVGNWEVLPSSKDTPDILHDFIPLVARVSVDRIPAFKHFKHVVVRHLPHHYSDVMKEKSEQVNIILDKFILFIELYFSGS